MREPIPCNFCGNKHPVTVAIQVHYHSPRKQGLHDMRRVACPCGAIGKCRPDADSAVEAWNEPWQAMVL